jgi:CheY-like chemotaxis protein
MERIEVKPEKIGHGKTVLVVDDVAPIRKAVAKAFLSDGFAICGEADNGREAIDLVKKLTPDLIVIDLAMPGMSGLQAAPQLRLLAPRAPIILLTLYSDALRDHPVSDLGIDLVLSKDEDLCSIVQKAHELMQSFARR